MGLNIEYAKRVLRIVMHLVTVFKPRWARWGYSVCEAFVKIRVWAHSTCILTTLHKGSGEIQTPC